MKKKLSFGVVLIVLLLLLSTAAVAVVSRFGILDYAPEQAENAAYVERILPLNQAWEGDFFSAVIHEAVFDGMKMTFTMSITPKENANPVFVVPRIHAFAGGKELTAFVQSGNSGFTEGYGFWVPDIMPAFSYDYESWGTDVALMDDERIYSPTTEEIEWEITLDVLYTDWPILFTEEDEPSIDESEWTGDEWTGEVYAADTSEWLDAAYAAYERQFQDAYQSGQILLDRYGTFNLNAMDGNAEVWSPDAVEEVLTQKAFTLAEKASFRFTADSAVIKTARDAITFSLPDGYEAELCDLAVAVDEIGLSLRFTRTDGEPASYSDFKWDFAILAEGAQTSFEGSSCGQREDGSILYTAQLAVSAATDRLILIPLQEDAGDARFIMEQGMPLTQAQAERSVFIELE